MKTVSGKLRTVFCSNFYCTCAANCSDYSYASITSYACCWKHPHLSRCSDNQPKNCLCWFWTFCTARCSAVCGLASRELDVGRDVRALTFDLPESLPDGARMLSAVLGLNDSRREPDSADDGLDEYSSC